MSVSFVENQTQYTYKCWRLWPKSFNTTVGFWVSICHENSEREDWQKFDRTIDWKKEKSSYIFLKSFYSRPSVMIPYQKYTKCNLLSVKYLVQYSNISPHFKTPWTRPFPCFPIHSFDSKSKTISWFIQINFLSPNHCSFAYRVKSGLSIFDWIISQ